MKRLFAKNHPTVLGTIALIVLAMLLQTTVAAEKPFPSRIYTNTGSPSEGFAIGSGTVAYNGSVDGSIYKMDLRTGQGGLLVPRQDPDVQNACVVLGMRVDPRTNYLFVAGCTAGNAYGYDADSGALIMTYQLGAPRTR
jgi:outer membrane protein assembly factor BamB